MNKIAGLEMYAGVTVLYAKHVYIGMRTIESLPSFIRTQVNEILAKIDAGEIVVDWLRLEQ